MAALAAALQTTDPFDASHVEAAVRGTAAERGIKAGPLIHATRVAVTGRTASPGLFEVLVLLGRERSLARLERLVNFLATLERHTIFREEMPRRRTLVRRHCVPCQSFQTIFHAVPLSLWLKSS